MEKTKIVNDPQQLTLFGERTPRAVIYKSESHKLHHAFNVKAGEKIVQGMPVALNEEGLIYPCTDEVTQVYLGVAVTDNVNPAYQPQRNFPVEVTVAMGGYMICNWVSNGNIEAGYVTPDGKLLNDRFVKANQNQSTSTQFIALNPAEEANEVIQVLIK